MERGIPTLSEPAVEDRFMDRKHKADKLKGRSADPKHPRFHVRINAERNNLAPFDLTE